MQTCSRHVPAHILIPMLARTQPSTRLLAMPVRASCQALDMGACTQGEGEGKGIRRRDKKMEWDKEREREKERVRERQ